MNCGFSGAFTSLSSPFAFCVQFCGSMSWLCAIPVPHIVRMSLFALHLCRARKVHVTRCAVSVPPASRPQMRGPNHYSDPSPVRS